MNGPLASFIVLLGVILIAAGIATAFVTGFDVLFSAIGLVLVIGGIALVWFFRPKGKFSDTVAGGPQRSVQKPIDSSEDTKRRISRRL
jgi:hypothetical protein